MSKLEQAVKNYEGAVDEYYSDGFYPGVQEQRELDDLRWDVIKEASNAVKEEIKALKFLKGIIGVKEYAEGCYCLVDLCSDNKDHMCDIDKEMYDLFKELLKDE